MTTSRRRVAMVVGQLSAGGTEHQLHELARRLHQSTSWSPVVFCTSGDLWPLGPRMLQDGIPIVDGRCRTIQELCRPGEFELCHSWGDPGGWVAATASRWARLPHLHSIRSEPRDPARRALRSVAVRGAELVTYNARHLRPRRGPRAFCPNGIDVGRFCPRPSRERATADGSGRRAMSDVFELLYVGRGVAAKDLPTLERVARRIAHVLCGERKVRLSLLGRGLRPVADRLARVDGLGVRHVSYDPRIEDRYTKSDVLLLTSRSEGTPNVILEAMASGCPVVATDVGGCSEVIRDGDTGWLSPAGDVEGLSSHVLRLARAPRVGRDVAQRARSWVARHHDWPVVVDRWLALYERVTT